MIPTLVPHGRTARRLEWAHLPPFLRAEVTRRCGAEVVDAVSQRAGYTPGFASVLTCADGSRHFVKAASVKAQRPFAEAYRTEARQLRALPADLPAPRLRWLHDADDWVVLGLEHVEARAPHRPWQHADVEGVLALTADLAERLTPVPPTMRLGSLADELADLPGCWTGIREVRPQLEERHVAEAAELAARLPEVLVGGTVVHSDIRDDNLLVTAEGRVLLCDWNWPASGPAWVDTVTALIGPRGDGVDVAPLLARHPLTADVPADEVDVLLALVGGLFLRRSTDPVPPTSPWLREVQAWQGAVVWDWLGARRGWS